MVRQSKATGQQLMRLDAIAENLNTETRFPDPDFFPEVVQVCLAQARAVIDRVLPCSGEIIAQSLANHFHVTFEEVRNSEDVVGLEDKYLKGKREIGFAQLRDELKRPGVDALLFQRLNAKDVDGDRWVAVLNLQQTAARGYWNRFHELGHRLAEPPQKILPFRRHRVEANNPVETIIDLVAAELAFFGPAFRPIVERFAKRRRLDLDVVRLIRGNYAPTASLLATMKAVVKYWPMPAAAITAEVRGRIRNPECDRALRVSPQASNCAAEAAGLSFFRNMRVPLGSPIHESHRVGVARDGCEQLSNWDTSQGARLSSIDVYTSAVPLGDKVYAVVSI